MVFGNFWLRVFGSKRESRFVIIVYVLNMDMGKICFMLLLIIWFCNNYMLNFMVR